MLLLQRDTLVNSSPQTMAKLAYRAQGHPRVGEEGTGINSSD